MTKYLTFEAIASVDDLPTKEVEMPEWGGTILVRGLSKGGYDDLKDAGGDDPRAHEIALVVACVAEPKLNAEQAKMLMYKSPVTYGRLYQAIAEVNRIQAVTETKSVAGGEPGNEVRDAAGAGSGEDAGRDQGDAEG